MIMIYFRNVLGIIIRERLLKITSIGTFICYELVNSQDFKGPDTVLVSF